MKYFQLPPALAFVARAITQMEGVGVMLDEDAPFFGPQEKAWENHEKNMSQLCFHHEQW